jgi:hypothetical protein
LIPGQRNALRKAAQDLFQVAVTSFLFDFPLVLVYELKVAQCRDEAAWKNDVEPSVPNTGRVENNLIPRFGLLCHVHNRQASNQHGVEPSPPHRKRHRNLVKQNGDHEEGEFDTADGGPVGRG